MSRSLAGLIAGQTPRDGTFETAVPGVRLIRWSVPSEPMPVIYEPTVCFVAQGRKRANVGATSFVYDRARHLIASVGMPVMGSVIEASEAEPYLCLQIDLDMSEIAELAIRCPSERGGAVPALGLSLNETSPELLDACVRLVALLNAPEDADLLASQTLREIYYRLLTSPGGGVLRQMAHADSRLNQIARAIVWIRKHFREACRIEQAADVAGMSRSNFHLHFRSVTSLSPLEFRKQLRMQEARRLMVSEGIDAANAGFNVGYDSPSQFSRDYSRLFGRPPASDAMHLRGRIAG